MWSKCIVDKFSLIVYLVCLVLAFTGKIPLSLIIIAAVISGIIYQKIEDKKTSITNEKGGV